MLVFLIFPQKMFAFGLNSINNSFFLIRGRHRRDTHTNQAEVGRNDDKQKQTLFTHEVLEIKHHSF